MEIKFTKSTLGFLWVIKPVIDADGNRVWRETYITDEKEYDEYFEELKKHAGASPFVELEGGK